MPTPYLRPHLEIRRTATAAVPEFSLERYACASSSTISSGRSRPPSGKFLAQKIASSRTRNNAPISSFKIDEGIPERSRIVIGFGPPIQSSNSLSRSFPVLPSMSGRQSPGLNRKASRGSLSLDAKCFNRAVRRRGDRHGVAELHRLAISTKRVGWCKLVLRSTRLSHNGVVLALVQIEPKFVNTKWYWGICRDLGLFNTFSRL